MALLSTCHWNRSRHAAVFTARFFFHTKDGETVCDEQGVELEDLQTARREATGLIAQMLRDSPDDFLNADGLSVTVKDGDGLTYFAIHVTAVDAPSVSDPALFREQT